MTFEITVIESDCRSAWPNLVDEEFWGDTEPHDIDGEQVGKNVVTVSVAAGVSRESFTRALDRDDSVLSYCEVYLGV